MEHIERVVENLVRMKDHSRNFHRGELLDAIKELDEEDEEFFE